MIEGFDAFLRDHASSIEATARFSFGELAPDDVRNEAWLQAMELAIESGSVVDLADETLALDVLRRVRRKLERTKRSLRKSRSIDQPLGGEDGPSLLDLMADGDGAHPLSLLEDIETQASTPAPFEFPDPYHSELAAWNCLLRRFGLRTRALAEFLMISTSWCYQRRKRIRNRFDVAQQSLPQRTGFVDDEAALQPWRKFKLLNQGIGADPRQGALDFWNTPLQPAIGQLWLL